MRFSSQVVGVSPNGSPGLLQQLQMTCLDHSPVNHELYGPAVGFQLDGRSVGLAVEMPQGVMGALMQVDEDLFGPREYRVGPLVPQDDRPTVLLGGDTAYGVVLSTTPAIGFPWRSWQTSNGTWALSRQGRREAQKRTIVFTVRPGFPPVRAP
jgi:hypothetical protein